MVMVTKPLQRPVGTPLTKTPATPAPNVVTQAPTTHAKTPLKEPVLRQRIAFDPVARSTGVLPRQQRAPNEGVGSGGTVALKTGFREIPVPSTTRAFQSGEVSPPDVAALTRPGSPEAVSSAVASISVDRIQLSSVDAPADLSSMRKLDPAAVDGLAKRRIIALGEKIAGVPSTAPDYSGKLSDAFMARNQAGAASGKRDEDLATLMRLSTARANGALEGAVDANGNVVLAEKTHPVSAKVQAQIDPARGGAAAKKMLTETANPAVSDAIVKDLAATVPANVLEALQRSGVSLQVVDGKAALGLPGSRAREVLGDKTAKAIKSDTNEGRAHYNMMFGDIRVSVAAVDSKASNATFARHEVMHAIDHAMGKKGWLSDEPGFKAIYDKTAAATERGDKEPAFPTAYAGTNAQELFAESAAIYLGTHVNSLGSAEMVTTREHMKKTNPEVYGYMERLFEKDLPAALKNNTLRGPERFTETARAVVAATEQIPESKRTSDDWYALAAMRTSVGALEGNVGVLKQADEAVAMAKKKNRGLFGLVARPFPQADELQLRIQAHLKNLAK